MNISLLYSCPHVVRSGSIQTSKRLGFIVTRSFATHRDSTIPSSLSQTLDTGRRHAAPRHESVGPFQLGVSPSRGEPAKKWSELSPRGKVIRTGVRTTNLTVILLGAGLSALLVYSLTTELFSKNSPTVLYSEACERIRASSQVTKYLNGPLTFHNNPPSSIRPRHRNRHVSSQIMVDSTGREHMIMNFYVQGKPPGSSQSSPDDSYFDSLMSWSKESVDSLSHLTFDESVAWVKETALDVWERSKSVFKYLSGTPMPPPPIPSSSPSLEAREIPKKESGAWSFAGMFSSLKGSKSGWSETTTPEHDGRIWTEGEVHADLVRNDEGYFVFRFLLIDIPNSRSRESVRVFVERGPGVRKDEPVIRWESSS